MSDAVVSMSTIYLRMSNEKVADHKLLYYGQVTEFVGAVGRDPTDMPTDRLLVATFMGILRRLYGYYFQAACK
jgi:hypothetical protein